MKGPVNIHVIIEHDPEDFSIAVERKISELPGSCEYQIHYDLSDREFYQAVITATYTV